MQNTFASAHPTQRDCSLPARSFDEDQSRYFVDNVPQTYTETNTQEKSFGNYVPEVTELEAAKTFAYFGLMDRTACSDGDVVFTTASHYVANQEAFTTDSLHSTHAIAEGGNKAQLKVLVYQQICTLQAHTLQNIICSFKKVL